jgi:thiol-disulfide isomerase/thioredoxin
MRRRTAIVAGLGAVATVGGVQLLRARETGRISEEVQAIEAPGSTAGRLVVPPPGTPAVVDLFATWCGPCVTQMRALGEMHRAHGEGVRFISVTNERLGGGFETGDIAGWWRAHGGAWTVAVDEGSDVMRAVGATGLPYLVGFDAAGRVRATHSGLASTAEVGSIVQAVR